MNFVDCSAIIYDAYGIPVRSTKILLHDAVENYIEVLNYPEFHNGMACELIILSEPAPYAYSGVVRTNSVNKASVIITLFKGKIKENRTAKRFKLSGTADIVNYVDDRKYDLHSHIKVDLVNISVGGVRLSSQTNTLSNSDQFDLKLEISNNDKILETKVVNISNSDTKDGYTEYGCLFLGESNG